MSTNQAAAGAGAASSDAGPSPNGPLRTGGWPGTADVTPLHTGRSAVGPQAAGPPPGSSPHPPPSGAPHVGTSDVGTSDVGASDVGTSDLGAPDVGTSDVGTPHVGAPEAADAGGLAPPTGGLGPSTVPTADEPTLGPTGRPRPVFPEPEPLLEHGPARVLAMCNQKGGVGKTTSAINLGAALAETGRRVLLVDLDPQGALSVGLGVNPMQVEHTVYDLLMRSAVSVDDVLMATGVPGMDLLPSNIDLSAAEVQLVNEVAREQTLARVLVPLLEDYDVVLIDCQPSLGLLTVNALTAADGVIIPLECEYFALRGVALLLQTIEKIRERLNPRLEVEGLLATMYDARTLHGREVLSRVVDAFGDKVFHTVINRTVRFPETTVAGEPITSYASSSAGATAYRELAREVLARGSAPR